MATKPISLEQFLDAEFPVRGIDLSGEISTQRGSTTRTGVNVRVDDPFQGRNRGGSRPGLSRYIDGRVWGDNKIDHLAVIVDPTTDALPANDEQDEADFVSDPTTSNKRRRTPAWTTRRIRRGGSGRRHTRNTPKKALTITASNQTKTHGTVFTFAGNEYTTSGLEVGDAITSVRITSAGAPASASLAMSPYDIAISRALGTVATGGTLRRKYKITYTMGQMTVNNSIAFVQQAAQGFDTVSASGSLAYPGVVTQNNLLVVAISVFGSSFTPTTVSDTRGNTYTLAERDLGGAAQVHLWYAVANGSGANTVSITWSGTTRASLAVLEYSGTHYTTPLDSTKRSSGGLGSFWTTEDIPTSGSARLLLGAFSQGNFDTAFAFTQSGGMQLRSSLQSSPTRMCLFVADKIQATGITLSEPISGTVGLADTNWSSVGASFKQPD